MTKWDYLLDTVTFMCHTHIDPEYVQEYLQEFKADLDYEVVPYAGVLVPRSKTDEL